MEIKLPRSRAETGAKAARLHPLRAKGQRRRRTGVYFALTMRNDFQSCSFAGEQRPAPVCAVGTHRCPTPKFTLFLCSVLFIVLVGFVLFVCLFKKKYRIIILYFIISFKFFFFF